MNLTAYFSSLEHAALIQADFEKTYRLEIELPAQAWSEELVARRITGILSYYVPSKKQKQGPIHSGAPAKTPVPAEQTQRAGAR